MNKTLTLHDIHKRLRGLSNTSNNNIYCEAAAETAIKNNIPKEIMRCIENTCRQTNPIQFESVLELYDALYECEASTTGQVVKMGKYICEEAIPKIRSAKDTNTNLRRKLGRMKSKLTTKIDNNIQDARATVASKIHAAQNNFKKNTAKIKNNVAIGMGRTKHEAYLGCYEDIINALSICEDCDRILDNYNRISRRFNLERLFVENTRINGYQDTVNELCNFIETYDMPDIVKYNTVIETAWYGFENNGIIYDKKGLLEAATDYFLMKPDGASFCAKILEATTIFNPEDMPDCMQVITELDPEVDTSIFKMHSDIQDQLSETTITLKEEYNFNKIFNDYKKQNPDAKDEGKLMWLVRKLYAKNVSSIVDETPHFLGWIRRIFILSTAALNPIITAVLFIGDIFAQLHFERDETEKMMKCFDKEIKESEAKMKSTQNPEEKRRLKEYIAALKKVRNKIDAYYEKMLTDKELDAKYDSDSTEEDSFDDIKAEIKDDGNEDDFDDFDWGDDDDDMFAEAAVDTISMIDDTFGRIEGFNDIETDTITHMDLFNADDMDTLAKLAVQYPEVWGPELMENAIEAKLNRIRKGKVQFESALARFNMVNACENAIKTIHTYKRYEPITIGDCKKEMNSLAEACEAISAIIYTHENKSVMVEASFMNSLKLAGEKLKKTMQNLSDKDRTISKNVDVSLSQFKKSMENTLTNENREAVIKGSILPSASKIIKLGITTGALWLISPVVAVINALGYLALSAKHKAKERQLILDELDVELKMCEKYIDIAESKNDMKSLKQLLTIQKNLKRQDQRIRYKMKVDFNQNVRNTED